MERVEAEQKCAEEAPRENEIKYRTLFQLVNDAIFLMAEDKFIDCNQQTLNMLGCIRKTDNWATFVLIFSSPLVTDGQDSKKKTLEKIFTTLNVKAQFFDWKHCQYNETPFDDEVSLNRIDLKERIFLQVITRDISKCKRAAHQLRESEDKYRTIFETTETATISLTKHRIYKTLRLFQIG